MTNDWHIFFWAMLHHPHFKYCYIKFPVAFNWRWFRDYDSRALSFSIQFQRFKVYLPYSVQDAYYTAHALPCQYDDIPF